MIHASNSRPEFPIPAAAREREDVWLGYITEGDLYAIMSKRGEYHLTVFRNNSLEHYSEIPVSAFAKMKPQHLVGWVYTAWLCYRIWDK